MAIEITPALQDVLTEMFRIYDSDHSGFIDIEENLSLDRALANKFGTPFDEEESRTKFSGSDANKDGKVTIDEFLANAAENLRVGDANEEQAVEMIMLVNQMLRESAEAARASREQ
mmetsp:Transcript_34232/g.91371  ORF Transcript_34232/g.91371 Transcript_34232/m.91371 type:complete len:116 (-) Transcript_34232:102-449(-)